MSRKLQLSLQPEVLRWARERAGFSKSELANKLKVDPEQVAEWERTGSISIAKLDNLASKTYTPLGFLYLQEPLDEKLPIPDFRTRSAHTPEKPSPNLLDTIEAMLRRQEWMRDELLLEEQEPLGFVGGYQMDSAKEVAEAMRQALSLERNQTLGGATIQEYLKNLKERITEVGVLVFFSGIVGNNTHRPIDPKEVQGFAFADEYAPLIFVNAADYKAAQVFTLAHEFAHLFIGKTGVSALNDFQPGDNEVEHFCDSAAAEFLVPEEILRDIPRRRRETAAEWLETARRRFSVSSVVVARRALDLEMIVHSEFFEFYEHEKSQWNQNKIGSGGNFWNSQSWRIGTRFGAAVVRAAKEERLLYRDAYRLTGLRGNTFENMQNEFNIKS